MAKNTQEMTKPKKMGMLAKAGIAMALAAAAAYLGLDMATLNMALQMVGLDVATLLAMMGL